MSTPVLGIDLGTTNTVVATIRHGHAVLLADDQSQILHPSAITLGEQSRIWIGREALALGATVPGRTAYAVKRLLGRKFNDDVVQRARRSYPYGIEEDPSDGGVLIELGGRKFTPEKISALIMEELVNLWERRFGQRPDEAVVTVPAYFNHTQRERTQHAATDAGLKVLRLLNEPTAAALSIAGIGSGEHVIAVYDFGGGTFDISIIRISGMVYEVLATNGDTFLGGDDIDGLLCDEFAQAFEQSTGVKLRNFPLSWYRLRDAAEKAKKELSFAKQCSVYLPRLVGEDSLITEIGVDRVEDLARSLLQRTISICEDTLKEAGLKKSDLHHVVLIGGQTRMPLLRTMVEEYFEQEITEGINPDTVVAEGAAREASMLREGGGALLLDVTPITLGINIAGNRLYPLISRNTKLPVRKEHMFTTHRDAQVRARMVVLQGENPVASENTRLGEIVLENLQGQERFHARIQVAFEIDANGILHVMATDQDTGEEQEVSIQDSFDPDGKTAAGQMEEGESLAPAEGEARPSFAGPFRATELTDVLYFLHANNKTGRIALKSKDITGEMWMNTGNITHASAGDKRGREAITLLLKLSEGDYSFHETEINTKEAEFDEPFEKLLESGDA